MAVNALQINEHDMISCHESNYLKSCHDSCHANQLSKSDWFYLVSVLEGWRVFNPRSVIKHYGALNCWEAMIKTKDFTPRVPGAYFTKTVRQISGLCAKAQNFEKKSNSSVPENPHINFSDEELFSDYKKASNFLCHLTKNDLRNPEIFKKSEELKKHWNFG